MDTMKDESFKWKLLNEVLPLGFSRKGSNYSLISENKGVKSEKKMKVKGQFFSISDPGACI